MKLKLFFLLPFIALGQFAWAGDRIDVDIAGGSIQTIQEAIDQANDGDIIVVKGNATLTYSAFRIDETKAKNLVIIADEPNGQTVRIRDGFQPVVIEGIEAGSYVALRDIQFRRAVRQFPALRIEDCSGAVWLEDVVVQSAQNTTFSQGTAPSVSISGESNVLFSDSRVFGIDALTAPSNPQTLLATDALHIFDSTVGIWGGRIQAGVGDNAQQNYVAAAGATGILATESDSGDSDVDLYLCGVDVVGGDGGDGWSSGSTCRNAEDGGNALVLDGADAVRLDASLQAGLGGIASPPCVDGSNGAEFILVPGSGASLSTVANQCRSMRSAGLAQSGTVVDWSFLGVPDESCALYVGNPLSVFTYSSPQSAPIAIANPAFVFSDSLSVLGSGVFPLSVSTNQPAQAFFGQSVFTGTSTTPGIVLGNPTLLVVLGP